MFSNARRWTKRCRVTSCHVPTIRIDVKSHLLLDYKVVLFLAKYSNKVNNVCVRWYVAPSREQFRNHESLLLSIHASVNVISGVNVITSYHHIQHVGVKLQLTFLVVVSHECSEY